MPKTKETAVLDDLGGQQHNGSIISGVTPRFGDCSTKDDHALLQLTIFGSSEPLIVSGVKVARPGRALRKGEPGWDEIYLKACRFYDHFRFDDPEFAEAVYREFCDQVSQRRAINGSETVIQLKNSWDRHFSNDARSALVMMCVWRCPEAFWATVQRDPHSVFASEGMPWEQAQVTGRWS